MNACTTLTRIPFRYNWAPPWSNGSMLDRRSPTPVFESQRFIFDFASLPVDVARPI